MSLNRSQDLYWPAHYIISCNKDGFKEVTRTLHVGVDGWYLLIVDRETEANVEVIELKKYTVELVLPKEQIIDRTTEEVASKMIL